MIEDIAPDDRRRDDRRTDYVSLADYTIPELRKAVISIALLLVVLGLFIYMVRDVLIPAIAGIVLGAYLIPIYRRLLGRLRRPTLTAIITITMVTVPVVGLMAYSWRELSDAAGYLNTHRDEIAKRLTTSIQRVPILSGTKISGDVPHYIDMASKKAGKAVDEIGEAGNAIMIGVAVLLFTAFYVLTDHRRLLGYIRGRIPGRYRELTDGVGRSIRAVTYGALYGTVVTQFIKSVIVLILNLLWNVPLAIVLAIVAFFVGFFPIVGSYIVYTPVAIYLMLWRGDVVGGVIMFLVGFLGNTMFISMYLRPKLAAERSHVLNFYWMFIALVTGVYTFGLVGVIIGPMLIAVLRAVFETISGSEPEQLPTVPTKM